MALLAWSLAACAPPLLSPDTAAPPRRIDADADGSAVDEDCDDADADRFPGNPEVCDGVDQDCSGVADDGLVVREYWPDDDGDGFGASRVRPIRRCFRPPGYVDNGLDCDDADAERSPGEGC